jgi:hypothetical protein
MRENQSVKPGIRGRKAQSQAESAQTPSSSVTDDVIREQAYLIWEGDRNKSADDCWLEAKRRLCK